MSTKFSPEQYTNVQNVYAMSSIRFNVNSAALNNVSILLFVSIGTQTMNLGKCNMIFNDVYLRIRIIELKVYDIAQEITNATRRISSIQARYCDL